MKPILKEFLRGLAFLACGAGIFIAYALVLRGL